MHEFLLNTTPVQVHDKEFENGFEIGYMRCKCDFLGKSAITDDLLVSLLSQPFVMGDIPCTPCYIAGYQTGVIYALLEREPNRTKFQIVGKIDALLQEVEGKQ